MKKNVWTLLLALVLCASILPAAAFAQAEPAVLEGFVTEVLEDGFVMEDITHGEVMLNTSEETVWDGILLDGELEAGQYVVVDYDGRMTFSLPPQAHADRVGCYVLEGMVTELLEDGFLLDGDPTFGNVIVHTENAAEHVYTGMPVTVYYDGVMTLSLPGRASARHIVMPQLTGEVSELTEEGFLLTDDDGVQYQVCFADWTIVSEQLPEVEDVMEEDAEITEETEEVEASEEAAEAAENVQETSEEPAEEPVQEDAQPVQILPADGERVTVYFNGATTRSIPAQLTAMEVLIHR